MIHFMPDGTDTLMFPPVLSASGSRVFAPDTKARHLDSDLFLSGIASRRQRFEELEATMVAICKNAAIRGAARSVRIDTREIRDRSTWQRYLVAVLRLEPDFMPQMLRLLGEIEQLERLLKLPLTSAAS